MKRNATFGKKVTVLRLQEVPQVNMNATIQKRNGMMGIRGKEYSICGGSVKAAVSADRLPGVLFYKSTDYASLSNVYRKFCQRGWL